MRYRSVPADLNPYLDTWDKSFRDWGSAAVAPKNPDGFYRLTKWDDDSTGAVVHATGKRFRGRVLGLVDGSNNSANVPVRERGAASGARPTRRGADGWESPWDQRIRVLLRAVAAVAHRVDLLLVAEFPTSPQPDAGLIPDVQVRYTARDIANGVDRTLQAALNVPTKRPAN